MKLAELSSPTLRNSDELTRDKFAQEVLSYLNPKFEGKTEAEKQEEAKISVRELMEFAKHCDLAPKEMILALVMTSKGRLYQRDYLGGFLEPLRLFREIDRDKLHKIESAYIIHKREDKVFERDTTAVSDFLEDLTMKKIHAQMNKMDETARERNLQKLLEDVEKGIKSKHGFLFYDELKEREGFEFKETAEEKWAILYKVAGKIIRDLKTQKIRVQIYTAGEIKELEKLHEKGQEIFLSYRTEPLLQGLIALSKTEIKNERVFIYLTAKLNEKKQEIKQLEEQQKQFKQLANENI